MTNIFDYIAEMDAAQVDNPTGDGICIFPLADATGTGTCGVVGLATLPAMTAEGVADWAPIGLATLPAMDAMGTTGGYRPAWGSPEIPAMTADGTAHVNIESQCLLPPLFATGSTGAIGDCAFPTMTAYGIDDSFNTTAEANCTFPALTAEAYVCGLANPISTAATSAAVVHLLQQGSITIADAAVSICAGLTSQDAMALVIIRFVADLMTYVSDGDGIGDTWMCAIATLQKQAGDCEDGAILAHSLMLAAGIDPGRIRTAFGKVMTTSYVEYGHAWVMYRRMTDEEWIPLDWTRGIATYVGALTTIARQVDVTDAYTGISYILTNERFYAVNDVNYIPKLAANRSDGAMIFPALDAAGATGINAHGAVVFSRLTATGRTGARGEGSFPGLASDGEAHQESYAHGDVAFPAMTAMGATGAVGALGFSALKAIGSCGTSASGRANFPALAAIGTATVETLASGALTFPRLQVIGRALTGTVVQGGCVFSTMGCTGRAFQGPTARGAVTFPRLQADGSASLASSAAGAVEFPPIIGRGHAVSTTDWIGILSYDDTRLS